MKWYGHAPGMVYAVSITANNEQEARDELRRFLGVKRLPRGSAVWLNNHDW